MHLRTLGHLQLHDGDVQCLARRRKELVLVALLAQASPSPVLRRDLWNLFHDIATGRGATLLVSSHVMDEAERCHRLLLMRAGEILVAHMTSPDWVPIMRRAAAIVTDAGGMTSHAAIVSRELGIPCVVGTKDGTRVPMFITARKGVKLDGTNPTLLYGYGGFAIAMTPAFSPAYAAWLERGGIFAQPSTRGGSEYGASWHAGGLQAINISNPAKPTQAARTSDSSNATTAGIPASQGRRPLAPKATSREAASISA